MAKKSRIEKNNYRKVIIAKALSKRIGWKKRIAELMSLKNDRAKALEEGNDFSQDKDGAILSAGKEIMLLSHQLRRTRFYSTTRYRNRCSVTGRARGILRKFGISRNYVRYWASFGCLMGVKKSS